MISEDEFVAAMEAARGDKEAAFVNLEKRYRSILHEKLERLDQQESNWEAFKAYYIEYVNHTVGTAAALGIEAFEGWKIPSHSESFNYQDWYRDFTAAVDSFSLQVRIARAEHQLLYSVRLSAQDKQKIRHYGEQIKQIIDNSALERDKREELLNLLNNFLKEVDRERTRMEAYGGLVVGIAHIVGESAKELDPLRAWLETIAKIFGKSQEAEQKTLPPARTKHINPPPKQLPKPDDDIPF